MSQTTFRGSVHVDTLSARQVTLPSSCVGNAQVAAGAGIDATKIEHQFPVRYQAAHGSAVANATHPVHVVRGATGEVVGVEVACTVAPTSSDTIVVDVQKSTGGGAFATILSGTVTLNSSSTARTVYAATISAASLIDGDILQVVVTGTNSSGQGLIVVITLREDAQ